MFKKEVDPRKKICDHLSKSNSDLKSHINDIHKEEKRHQCKDCGKSFAQMDP